MFLSLPFFPWCKCNVLFSYLCPNFLINNVLILMRLYNISFCIIYSGLLKRTQFSWNVTTLNASLGSWRCFRIFIIHQESASSILHIQEPISAVCVLCVRPAQYSSTASEREDTPSSSPWTVSRSDVLPPKQNKVKQMKRE